MIPTTVVAFLQQQQKKNQTYFIGELLVKFI